MTAPERPAGDAGARHGRHTLADLAQAAGISESSVRRFFRALGFPDVGPGAHYDEDDLRVLTEVTAAAEQAHVDLATAIRLVRAVGQNVARMSDWQVAAIAARAEQVDGPDHGHQVTEDIAAGMSRALEGALLHSYHRHVEGALARLDTSPSRAEGDTVVHATVGFADLVNFSALSNELDSDRLGELVEIFEARSGDVVAAHDGRMVKTIGDSVLFLVDDADRAMDIAGGLIDVIGHDARLPDVRIGLATGTAVVRLGDVFGPPVNLAARLTAMARRNRVIVDDATVRGLRRSSYETRRLTARALRGFGLVEPVSIRRVEGTPSRRPGLGRGASGL